MCVAREELHQLLQHEEIVTTSIPIIFFANKVCSWPPFQSYIIWFLFSTDGCSRCAVARGVHGGAGAGLHSGKGLAHHVSDRTNNCIWTTRLTCKWCNCLPCIGQATPSVGMGSMTASSGCAGTSAHHRLGGGRSEGGTGGERSAYSNRTDTIATTYVYLHLWRQCCGRVIDCICNALDSILIDSVLI